MNGGHKRKEFWKFDDNVATGGMHETAEIHGF